MSRRRSVVVLDHGYGNVRSAVRALTRVGAEVELTADPGAALAADGLVVPGVGAFAAVAAGVRAVGGDEVVAKRLAAGRPVLGICVGLQVLFETSTEPGGGDRRGLGCWPGVVDRLPTERVPHMGWNTVEPPAGSVLFDGLAGERFYFVHSYAVLVQAAGAPTGPALPSDSSPSAASLAGSSPAGSSLAAALVTRCTHEQVRFAAAVEQPPLSGTQFHPEKSGDSGARLLANWVRSLG